MAEESCWKLSILEAITLRDQSQKYLYSDVYEKYQKLSLELSVIKSKRGGAIQTSSEQEKSTEKINDLKNEIEALKLQIVSKDTRISMMNEDIENLKSDSKELRQEIEVLTDQKREFAENEEIYKTKIAKLEQIILKLQNDYASLLTKYMTKLESQVEEVNKANEKLWSKSVQFSSLPDIRPEKSRPRPVSVIPSKIVKNFDLPEDSLAISYSNSGNLLAASSGNHVYLFRTEEDLKLSSRLRGPINFVNSVDFSETDYLVVAASSDKACYLWNTDNNNLVDNITGHTDKVSVAKFMSRSGESLASAGRDRSLKLWDLKSKTCIHSIFLNSSCFDLVSIDSMSGISAHMDKYVRVFDFRSAVIELEISIPDKITSIYLSSDKNSLLVSSRDDCLHLFDTRLSSKIVTLSDKSLKIPCDYSKCSISPDNDHALVGSSNETAIIWNISSNSVAKILQGGHKFPVIFSAWNPNGNGVVTCDSRKHLTLWH